MATAAELHPDAEVRRQRRNRAVLISNLKNTGLNMPGVEIAYRAALLAGATDEMAWEAARRQALIDTCRALPNPFAPAVAMERAA